MNLIEKAERRGSILANYLYLADGTKLAAVNSAGEGLCYSGFLVYRKQGNDFRLESAGFPGGRFVATASSVDTYYHMTDVVATLIPCVPGSVNAGLKAVRTADKAIDATTTVNKAADAVKIVDKVNDNKKFGAAASTDSKTAKEALRKAKDQNGIPRSQQPNITIKPNTPQGKAAGLDSRNVKQYEYSNSKGEKMIIRQDNPATYSNGGSQPAHFNAGPDPEKLKQHHNYGN